MLLAGLYYKGTPTPVKVSLAALSPLSSETTYNYPNPFSDKTTIRFNMDEMTEVKIRIYDANGRLVWNRNIPVGDVSYGANSIVWYGSNNSGVPVSNGIYMFEIRTENEIVRKKTAIIK
jgi:flagellar hook assembly protein FlgD